MSPLAIRGLILLAILACIIGYAKFETSAIAQGCVDVGDRLRARTEFKGFTEWTDSGCIAVMGERRVPLAELLAPMGPMVSERLK